MKIYGKQVQKKLGHEKEYRTSSPRYHHGLKPNIALEQVAWGHIVYRISTNSLGFKDKEPHSIEMSTQRRRMLFLGDSFTEGIGVEYLKTFAGIVEQHFMPQDVEILNGGVSSYSPAIYYAKTKYLVETIGVKLSELVIFLDISDIYNDGVEYDIDGDMVIEDTAAVIKDKKFATTFETEAKRRRSAYQKIERILRRDFFVTHFLFKTGHDLLWGHNFADDYDSINIRGALWTVDQEIFHQFGEKGLERCEKNLNHLLALCRKNGIFLTLAVYPWPDQIVRNDLHSIQVRYWEKWARDHEVQFINFFPDFIPAPHTAEKVKEILDTYFIPGDMHWNAAGHQKIADIFVTRYRQHKNGPVVQ